MPDAAAVGIESAPSVAESPVLEIDRISKWMGRRRILDDLSLQIPAGKVTCLIGPSGAGKTTLLRCMNLLMLIDEGEIRFEGKPVIVARRLERRRVLNSFLRTFAFGKQAEVAAARQLYVSSPEHRQKVSMVFQEFNLWPDRTILENLIEGPVQAKHEERDLAIGRAHEILNRVSLPNVAHRFPHQLSGGQRQRVAIARALMMRAKLILADEITSALDPELVGEVLDAIRALAFEGTSMVLVTHHIEFARHVADQVAVLDQGRVVECGRPSVVLETPQHEVTARFIRRLLAVR